MNEPDPAAVRAAQRAIAAPCVCGGRDNPDCERCALVAVVRAYLVTAPAPASPTADARPEAFDGEGLLTEFVLSFGAFDRQDMDGRDHARIAAFAARLRAHVAALERDRDRLREALGDALIVLAARVITDDQKPYAEIGPDLRQNIRAAHDKARAVLADAGRPAKGGE